MIIAVPPGRGLQRGVLRAAAALTFCLAGAKAWAGPSMLRTYGTDQGLESLEGSCMVQDPTGYLLACTDGGIFVYNGRRFSGLGPAQGLRSGGIVNEVVVTSTGRVALAFPDEVLVADRQTDDDHAPATLQFSAVLHPGVSFYGHERHRLAAWGGGLVLLTGDGTAAVSVPADGPAHVEAMGYSAAESDLLRGAERVFAVGPQLWETFGDGRICTAVPGSIACYTAADGLLATRWLDVAAGPGGQVFARSAHSVARFDRATRRWTVMALPDQGGRYMGYERELSLFTSPDGRLMTQAIHGLAVFDADVWHVVSVQDGAPPGIILAALADAGGQFWFQVLGRGLVRWSGYGKWDSITAADGLSDGIAWRTARGAGGPLWVATDSGVDEVVRRSGAYGVARVLPGASYGLAVSASGALWRGYLDEGVRVTDPASGAETRIAVPAVNVIVPDGRGQVWLGTRTGLYRVRDMPGEARAVAQVGQPQAEVPALVADGGGGVFYLADGRLRHLLADGTDGPLVQEWPTHGFDPAALARAPGGELWVGGAGGLVRVTLAGERVASLRLVPEADIRSNSVVALMVDHRGWLWAGTPSGVSVYDGRRWVSADADAGLLSDDVNQDGIREDPDGSVWITTTQGLARLIDPGLLFAAQPVRVVVSSLVLGSRPVAGGKLAYSRAGLAVQFGTPSFGAERAISFRYQLSGVDAAPVETVTGVVRYAFVPPGLHVLSVVGTDGLTHETSPVVSVVIDMAYPWWRQSWAEAVWALGALFLIWAALRLRDRAMLARQAELERHVAAATEQLRYDCLTGLFNRSEIEKRLARLLAGGRRELIVALLDIDHFKRVNDCYGHLGGDDVLRAMGRLVSGAVRDGECAGRYGGEEILILLNDSDGRGAGRVLALLHAVRGTPFNAAGQPVRVTCSIGMAWAVSGDDWESLIGRADDALYEAKNAGRDRVVERARGVQVLRGGANERRARPAGQRKTGVLF